MAFPSNPSPGDTHIENNTTWVYGGSGWYRSIVGSGNETTYTSGGGGSATAAGSAGEIQYTDGTNLAASPNLLWDSVNDELEVGGDIILDDGGTYNTTLQMVTPTANRTISFPDATGTVALVAGSSGQLTYNNAGAQAGDANLTWNATTGLALGKPLNVNIAGAASTPSVSFLGSWFTGGTSTTTKPKLLIEPSGTTSTAWSTSGTGLGINAASGFAGNLLDLQVNGTSLAKVTSGGVYLTGTGGIGPLGAGNGILVRDASTASFLALSNNGINVNVNAFIGWSSAATPNTNAAGDLTLYRDAADTLAQRRSTNAQTYRIYNSYTDASNYERGFLRWSSNVFEIGSEGAGTGSEKPVRITAATLKLPNLPTYADNTAATSGGLVAGDVYKTATGELRITV